MLNFTNEEINKAFQKVNPQVQKILNDDWVTEDIAILGKNIKIRINQVAELSKIVGYIFLKLIPLSKFVDYVESELEVSHERALEISEKVDQEIFSKVRREIFDAREGLRPPQQDIVEKEIPSLEDQDALRESLLKEIEEHAEESSDNSKESLENIAASKGEEINKLKEVTSSNLTERKVDPYREIV